MTGLLIPIVYAFKPLHTSIMPPSFLLPPTFEAVEPLLDAMWHYECVVTPKQLKSSSNPSISSPPSLSASQEQQWLQKVFQTFDEDGDGRLTHTQLLRSMQKMGISMALHIVERLLSSVSPKADNHLDLQDFILLYESTSSVMKDMREEDEDLRAALKVFDRNGDGYICGEEVQRVLCEMGLMRECERMIRRVDEDGNGFIDFAEFKKMMCSSQLQL